MPVSLRKSGNRAMRPRPQVPPPPPPVIVQVHLKKHVLESPSLLAAVLEEEKTFRAKHSLRNKTQQKTSSRSSKYFPISLTRTFTPQNRISKKSEVCYSNDGQQINSHNSLSSCLKKSNASSERNSVIYRGTTFTFTEELESDDTLNQSLTKMIRGVARSVRTRLSRRRKVRRWSPSVDAQS
ncbi:uncharacterized protein LOC135204054 [Macrobrachium nipponense]|uniref:uncharacterized protein LOC135204054 n=1 Tax=Macrobrachium nipponense TaxID=159736 RepID=UPI0030C7B482